MERRKTEQERKRNIIVGLTTLGGLVGLVVLLTAFGYVPALLRSGYEVTLYMDDVAGLRTDSRVTLWGQEIGEVKEVGFSEPDAPAKTYAKMLIDGEFDVPEGVDVRVETPIFGGGPVIALVGGSAQDPKLSKDGTAQLSSAHIVNPVHQLEKATDKLSEVGDNINTLFGDPQAQDQPSLARVVLGLEDRLVQLERVFGGAEKWLDNDQLREDVNTTAANARQLSETLSETVGSLEKRYLALADAAETRLDMVDRTLKSAEATLDTAGKSITEIERNYVALAADAAKVITVIDKLVRQAETKDSTIGLLLSDPALYQNLNDTAERLKLMTDEARLLIEKWKAEGLPLKIFD